jgi:TonB family protein
MFVTGASMASPETTQARLDRVLGQLKAETVACPAGLDRFGESAEADCVSVAAKFKQIRKSFRREFDKNTLELDTWIREGGRRTRLLMGSEELYTVVYDPATGTLAIVPYRACPRDPSVHSEQDANLEPATLIEQPPPDYPPEAMDAGMTGIAFVRLRINERGGVSDICLIVVQPPGFGFGQAAVQALRQSRFEPATVDGKPVPTYRIQYLSWSMSRP